MKIDTFSFVQGAFSYKPGFPNWRFFLGTWAAPPIKGGGHICYCSPVILVSYKLVSYIIKKSVYVLVIPCLGGIFGINIPSFSQNYQISRAKRGKFNFVKTRDIYPKYPD